MAFLTSAALLSSLHGYCKHWAGASILFRLSVRAWLGTLRLLVHRTHCKDSTAISGGEWQQIKVYSIKMAVVKPSEGGKSRKTLLCITGFCTVLHKSLMISKIKEQVLLNFLCSLVLIFKSGKKYFPQGRGAQFIISELNPLLLAREWNYYWQVHWITSLQRSLELPRNLKLPL